MEEKMKLFQSKNDEKNGKKNFYTIEKKQIRTTKNEIELYTIDTMWIEYVAWNERVGNVWTFGVSIENFLVWDQPSPAKITNQ